MNIQNYEIVEKIGKGAFAKVYKIEEKSTKQVFAAKVIDLNQSKKPEDLVLNLKREVSIMLKLNHPSILKFIGFSPTDFRGNEKPTLIIEYMPNGSLKDILLLEKNSTSHKYWNDTRKLICIYGIASAMSYLHSHDVIHRDLKPDNILMDKYLFPKVADFG